MASSTSLTTRPINSTCNFNAAGNPIVYTFTTTGTLETNFRIEVEVYKVSDDTSLNGTRFSFTPNAAGITTVNISACVLPYIYPDWVLPTVTNVAEVGTSLGVYIKWAPQYDGHSNWIIDGIENDSQYPVYPMFATNQIGTANGANMLDYFIGSATKKWLTKFQLNASNAGLAQFRDWPLTVSFIWPDSVVDLAWRYIEYNAANGVVITGITTLDDSVDNTVDRLLISNPNDLSVRSVHRLIKQGTSFSAVTITNGSFTGSAAPWSNSSSGQSWVYASNAVSVTALLSSDSKIFTQTLGTPISVPMDGKIKMSIDILIPVAESITVKAYAVTAGGAVFNLLVSAAVIGDGSSHVEVLTSAYSVIDEPIIGLGFRVSPGGTSFGQIIVTSVSFDFASAEFFTEDLQIAIKESCDYDEDNNVISGNNPVMLVWKNSLGGDAQWLFDLYHTYSYAYSNGKKAKRLILYAKELSLVQWEAINELNTLGEIYSPAITQLSSSVNATSKRVGVQVYMIDQDGNKTGVIVIPSSDKLFARDITHGISIEIELPEILAIQ